MQALLWLLRLTEPRNLFLAVSLIAVVTVGVMFRHIPKRYYRERMYPSVQQPQPDLTITKELDKREMLKIRGKYRKILALIAEARESGINVDGQTAKAEAAYRIAQSGFTEEAYDELSKLEMLIPRRRQQYIPMNEQAVDEGAWPGEQPKSVGSSEPATAKKSKPAAKRRRAR